MALWLCSNGEPYSIFRYVGYEPRGPDIAKSLCLHDNFPMLQAFGRWGDGAREIDTLTLAALGARPLATCDVPVLTELRRIPACCGELERYPAVVRAFVQENLKGHNSGM